MILLKKQLNFSLRHEALLKMLLQEAIELFNKKEKQAQLDQKKNIKISTGDYNSPDMEEGFNPDINAFNYFVGIEFDEQVNQAEINYFNALQEKANFLILLTKDFLDLEKLKKKGMQVMKLKIDLHAKLLKLFNINQNSQKLQFYIDGFSTYFGFGQKARHMFKRKNFSSSQIMKIDQNIYDKNSCVIFVSLANNIGEIVRLQNRFENMFGYDKNQMIHQNIGIIIPVWMRKKHEEILYEFLKNPSKQRTNQFPLALGQNKKGFAVPMSIKFRPDNLMLEDCGLTVFLQKIINEFDYIQLQANHFQIQCLTNELYDKCFAQFFHFQNIYKVQLNRILPILNTLESIKDSNEVITTLAYLPKIEIYNKECFNFRMFDKLDNSHIKEYIRTLTIEFFDIYSVQCRLIKNNYKKFSFHILEVQTFKKIVNFQSQKDALMLFKTQLDNFLHFEFDITNDLGILEQLIELQELEEQKGHSYVGYEQQQINEINQEDIKSFHDDNFFKQTLFITNELDNWNLTSQRDLISERDDILNYEGSKQNPHTSFSKRTSARGNMEGIESQSQSQSNNIILKQDEDLQSFRYRDFDSKVRENESKLLKSENQISNSLPIQSLQPKNFSVVTSPSSVMGSPYFTSDKAQLRTIQPFFEKNLALKSNNKKDSTDQSYYNSCYTQRNGKRTSSYTTNQESKCETFNTQTHQKMREKNSMKQLDNIFSVTHIFNEYYEQVSSDLVIKEGRRKNKTTIENNFEFQQSMNKERTTKSYFTGVCMNTKQVNLQQILKDKVKFVKASIQFLQNKSDQNSKQKLKPIHKSKREISQETHMSNEKELRIVKRHHHNMQKPKTTFFVNNDNGSSSDMDSNSSFSSDIQTKIDKQSRRLGTSSVQTSQVQNQEHKKMISRLVNSSKKNIPLLVLMIFGIISLVSFLSIVIYQYFQNIDAFKTVQLNFSYLPWALTQRVFFSKTFSDYMLKEIIKSKMIPFFGDESTELAISQARFDNTVQTFKNNTVRFFYKGLEDTPYFQFTQETKLIFVISKDIKSIPEPLVNNTSYKMKQNITMHYFMLRQVSLFWRAAQAPDLQTQVVMEDNFVVFMNVVGAIKLSLQSSVLDQIDIIENRAQVIMIFVIIAVFIQALLIFPINFFIKQKNEETLKLFSTISSLALFETLQPILTQLAFHKSSCVKLNQFAELKKKRAISSTSSLKKIKLLDLWFVIIGIMLMIIQPIVSYIYIQSFSFESNILTNLTQTLYFAKPFMASNQAVNYSLILYKLKTFDIYNPKYYYQRIVTLNGQIQGIMNSIQEVVRECQSSTRYEEELYQEFFYKLANGDICTAVSSYPDYVPSNINFDVTKCQTIRNGLMKKGIQLTIKDYVETFRSMAPYYNLEDAHDFASKFNAAMNLKEFDDYFDLITQTIEIMNAFLLNRINSFIQEMNNIFQGLLIYQLMTIVVICYFGYFKFYIMIEEEILGIKRLLNILSIEIVSENPYILSFLKKEQQ